MPLKETQNLLARLYTDESLRQQFLSAPAEIGAANSLSLAESEQLAAILPGEIEQFAAGLFYKRLRQTEKLLPLARKILDERFADLFRRFANDFSSTNNFSPVSAKKPLADALGFASFLRQQNQTVSRSVADLAGFEAAKLEFNHSARLFLIRRFEYDVRKIVRIAESSAPAEAIQKLNDLNPRRTVAVWLRVPRANGAGMVRHFVW